MEIAAATPPTVPVVIMRAAATMQVAVTAQVAAIRDSL
jgi:hypothetical protein